MVHFGGSSEREFFVENLSMLLVSGMTVLDGLDSVKQEIKSYYMRHHIQQMMDDVESGFPLWKTLKKSKLFSGQVIALIKTGEESGQLSKNLKVVAFQEKKNRNFQSKIRSASMYPVFVLGLTGVVGLGVGWFILPRLATVFDRLHVDLPLPTRVLINIGIFLQNHGKIFVPSVIAGIIIIFVTMRSMKFFRNLWQRFLFRAPITKTIIQQIEVSRLGYLLGSLLEAGVPVTQAFQSLEESTTHILYKKFFGEIKKNVVDGYTFQQMFKEIPKASRFVPRSMQQIIIAGERSGNLSKSFIHVGEIYEARTETTMKNLSTIIEPVLLVIVWIGVMLVALSVILPIYGLFGGLG